MHDIFRSRVIFLVPVFCWKAEGDVSLGFGAGVAGLGFVLPRGPGSGEGAVAHKGSPPLLSGVELGGWSRGAWLLAPWARWRRRRVGGVGGRWAIDDLGPDVAGVLWRGVHYRSRLGPAEDPPLVTVCSEVPPLGECGRDTGSSEGLQMRAELTSARPLVGPPQFSLF